MVLPVITAGNTIIFELFSDKFSPKIDAKKAPVVFEDKRRLNST